MRGKSICVVNDLTIEEQRHLYEVASVVRKQLLSGSFPQFSQHCCSYLMFLEDSTRTKESFRNAAETLSFRTNLFDATSSSLNKFETLNDTVRMLCGYTAMPTVFVIRSKIEGLCQSLHDAMGEYAARANIHRPSFVNAGDGKHEHPTQEFLDEFSFIQQLGGKTDSIHIALVGDLLLGRTVHSKADGLRIFKNVVVDLVAPKELQLPAEYYSKMEANGFKLNVFDSLDEYLASSKVAPILYFTRLQLERMDKSMLEKEKELRLATTLRMEMLAKLPKGAKIYHPLPRHGEMPEIPFEVDKTEFNGYDEQSRNGFYVRTALLGLLTGVYEDVSATTVNKHQEAQDFEIKSGRPDSVNPFFKTVASISTEPVAWIEVEFPQGTCPSKVRKAISRLRALSDIETKDGFCQITVSRGVHSVPIALANDSNWQSFFFTFFRGLKPSIYFEEQKNEFHVIFSQGSVQNVREMPGLHCRNPACVSHPESRQRDVPAVFHPSRLTESKFTCRYCEREHSGLDLFL